MLRLEYEAYRPMAERVLARIGEEVGRGPRRRAWRWSTGSASSSPGRGRGGDRRAPPPTGRPAFRACEECLERLKHDAPIWKREVFEDGSEWVGMGP